MHVIPKFKLIKNIMENCFYSNIVWYSTDNTTNRSQDCLLVGLLFLRRVEDLGQM